MKVNTQANLNIATPFEHKSIVSKLCGAVRKYFDDAEHQREFQEWYFKKYGVPYKFKRKEAYTDAYEKEENQP